MYDRALSLVPTSRIRVQKDVPLDPDGAFVLYWMTTARRTRYNFALQRAAELCLESGKPLLVLEALRVDYPHASDRLHTFVIEGMQKNGRTFAASRVTYYPYVEPRHGAGRGLLATLSTRAAAVVTDWYPEFFLPRMLAAATTQCHVRLEAVDTNGLIPVADHGRAFPTARGYRAMVQRTLRQHLAVFPLEDPLTLLKSRAAEIPDTVAVRWPRISLGVPAAEIVRNLAIDHSVPPVSPRGGESSAGTALREFLANKLARYGEEANDPDADCTSRLSPYLHFGHISAHEVFAALMTHERWTFRKIGKVRAGARSGWWNVSPGAEQFLDQLTVWRELAFNGSAWTADHHSYSALPAWARATLEAHVEDPRPHLYTPTELDAARTGDLVWNAAQNELRETGWCHGYMRMIWGKKILEWCRDPAEALDRMEALMNRYSLDGRDPVSYLNYAWVLGRYDRPWFERPIFGTVRYMTSESARRKLKMNRYLERFGGTDRVTERQP
jgi:deoxyribodipyrimidine photo-lyase